MLAAVMHSDGVAYEIRENGRRTAPCLEHFLLAGFVHCLYTLEEDLLDVRSLFDTSAHECVPPFPYLPLRRFTIYLSDALCFARVL